MIKSTFRLLSHAHRQTTVINAFHSFRHESTLDCYPRINLNSMDKFLKVSSPQSLCCSRGAKRSIVKDGKRKAPKTVLTNREMARIVPIEDFDARIFGVISKLKSDYNINLSLRTGTGIETLPVDLEGEVYPLKEIAQISRKSANTVVVNLSAIPDALKPVNRAISDSGMNVSLQQEGSTLILTLPKMSREHRENLAKSAKSLLNEAKTSIQELQKTYVSLAQEQQLAGISSDDIYDVGENIKFRANEAIKKCEEMCKVKTKELLE